MKKTEKTNCTECIWMKLSTHKPQEKIEGLCSNPKSPFFATIVDSSKSCDKIS